jgi:hypothetical protein
MPWNVRKRGKKWCVIKVGESAPVPGGCHDTREEAVRHQRALYAGENSQLDPLWSLLGPKEAKMAHGDPQNVYSSSGTIAVTYGDNNWVPLGTIETVANGDASATITFVPTETELMEVELEVEEGVMPWEGVLAVEGLPTSDGRYLIPGKIDYRELPLSLMVQNVTDEGHKGAFVAGKITSIRRELRPDLGEGAIAIIGTGVFSSDEDGQRAQQWLDEEVLRHVSIDFAPTAEYLIDPETLEIVDIESLDIMELMTREFMRGFEGKIMGATLCAFSAFEDATMQIVDLGEKVLISSAFPMRVVLTASAAGLAPLRPPKDFFFQPEPDGPFPLTVMPDGRVMGHLAVWHQCHRSMAHSCELAPKSRSKYAYFHTGAITTEEGEKVNVGRITVGEGGHASVSPYLGLAGATDHYDKTGMVGAFVRATDGKYGIWLSGVVRSDCPAEKVRDMEANPPSGDWREENGRLELCAALSVPVAGFPVPRYEAALVASGGSERVVALVASGYTEPGVLTRADMRRFETLKMKARKAFSR